MKFLTQVVLPIGIVALLVGVVTFVSQYTGSRAPKTKSIEKTAIADPDDPWQVRVETAQWGNENEPPEMELHSRGHYDFGWYRNRVAAPLEIGLERKSCTCASVSVAVLTPDEVKEITTQGPAVEATVVAAGPSGLLSMFGPLLGAEHWNRSLLEKDGRWQPVSKEENKTVTIPAAESPERPVLYAIRLHWQAKENPGPQRLKAELWKEQGNRGRQLKTVEVPVTFVTAMRPEVQSLALRDLSGRDARVTADFRVWSSTRAGFPLTVQEENRHPCFHCETTPLTEAEREELASKTTTRVLSGFRVTVTAHERRDRQQLDLGPLHRKLVLSGPDGEQATVALTGRVRGEVVFVNENDREAVDLSSFKAKDGASKAVALTLEANRGELRLASWKPDGLKVTLEKQKRKPGELDGKDYYKLEVTVPPGGHITGRLPADSAVILQMQGTMPRRMRIPVLGQATQ